MKLMDVVLEKLVSTIEMIREDGIPWDLTSRHPMDFYIDTLVYSLMKLLEIRGMGRAGNDQRYAASVEEGVCGTIIRARCFGRGVTLLVRTEGPSGAHEEVPVATIKPSGDKNWSLLSCTYEV